MAHKKAGGTVMFSKRGPQKRRYVSVVAEAAEA